MTSSKTLIDLACRFAGRAGATCREDLTAVNLTGSFGDEGEQEQWAGLLSGPSPEPFVAVSVRHAAHQAPLESSARFKVSAVFLITMTKRPDDDRAWFIFAEEALRWLAAGDWKRDCRVAGLLGCDEIRTQAGAVRRWESDGPPMPELPLPANAVDPVTWVRDLTGRSLLAPDILRWIPQALPGACPWRAWADIAALQLARSLCNRLTPMREKVRLEFTGPPTAVLVEDSDRIASAFTELVRAAEWVFLASDIEVRHGFFSGEFARTKTATEEDLAGLVDRALQAAQELHRAHLRSAGRETLRAIADLRKAVFDETQRVSQRAVDLTAGLAKDVPAAAAPLVVKVLADGTKVDPSLQTAFTYAAAAYLFGSFVVQSVVAVGFVMEQHRSRRIWLKTLHGALPVDELTALADRPFVRVETIFWIVYFLVGVAYGLLVLGLVASADAGSP